ncbi:CLUMA_CG010819, isoform A [Clunio marinus]|uniref:N-terminal methionine N(alpha)-acetyltransferase NatC n=1 Tax=Clunio marinus TaxID=568069 RepID=A0A1J1IEK1_9DIPT|nr:CLUMA_CG010819, isoform A [Clunio marinus]
MEEVESKLQNVVISDVKSNHIVDNSHSVLKANKEKFRECQENGDEQLPNGLQSPTTHQTSTENEGSTELSELSSDIVTEEKCSETPESCETIEVVRDNKTFRITYKVYESELELPSIMKLIQKDLSEPYSIYTYRYFINNWPKLCYLALYENKCVGCIVCKLDIHRQITKRGYIAMLAVDKEFRKLKIGTTLVQKAIRVMRANQADEVVLETEITNQPALKLYENLGFVRDKRLFHYYLNGVDALRLKLWFR